MKGKIFNAQEVQAMLNGTKVMFREVIKLPTEIGGNYDYEVEPLPALDNENYFGLSLKGVRYAFQIKRPYQVGQKIFCKEVFYAESNGIRYFSEIWDRTRKWKPAQHMKQEHSRLTLLIKEIKVERLAEISDKDLLKEGMQITDEWTAPAGDLDFTNENMDAFKDNWNATHKKPEEKFEASPFVWCVNFEVINN